MKDLQIFISYRRENGGIAYAYILNERLSSLGIKCFFDIDTMHDYSKDFEIEIENNIKASDYVIVLLQNGALKERSGIDYFLKEIRLARANNKEVLLLPIGSNFIWETQEQIPEDLTILKKLNLCIPLTIQDVTESIHSLLSRMKNENRHLHYLLLFKMQNASKSTTSAPILQKTSDIYFIDIKERWDRATRISLMAVGCSSVVHRFSPLIQEKAKAGTKFRFLALDPDGDSAKDFSKNKINANTNGSRDNFIAQNYEQTTKAIQGMKMSEESIAYRLTSDHITFTMHWVECINDNESYIYVEYIPIHSSNVLQDSHSATIIKRQDAAYDFYVNQFNECWRKARNGLKNIIPDDCEFCHPPEKDDKYILCDTSYWRIYFANNQNYPGRCIIPLLRHCSSLSDISEREMSEFHDIVKLLERIWKDELGATNFNWTCLMNGGYAKKPYVPHVHFHFIPRYDHPVELSNGQFTDTRFGGHYELSEEFQLSLEDREKLCQHLRERILSELPKKN